MIGQTIEYRPRPPLDIIVSLLVATALDLSALVLGNPHLAVASLLPWFIALLLWRARPRPFTARFTETALEVEEPPLEVPYADLQGLIAPRRPHNPYKAGPRSYAIQVIHGNGVLEIPARLNVHSDDVYAFLFGRFSQAGSRDVPAQLADYLRLKERAYGVERVWSYRGRDYRGHFPLPRGLKAFFLALLLSGIAWLVWGIVCNEEGWMAVSIVPLGPGVMCTLLFWLHGRRPTQGAGQRKGRRAGLVISPDGLAMMQNNISGELRWDELRESKHMATCIILKVEAAVILITDIYDRPLALIHQNICHYWRGQASDDRAPMPHLPLDKVRPTAPEPTRPRPSDGIAPAE